MTHIPIFVYRCGTCDEVRAVTESRPSAATCYGPPDQPHLSRSMTLIVESSIEVTTADTEVNEADHRDSV